MTFIFVALCVILYFYFCSSVGVFLENSSSIMPNCPKCGRNHYIRHINLKLEDTGEKIYSVSTFICDACGEKFVLSNIPASKTKLEVLAA